MNKKIKTIIIYILILFAAAIATWLFGILVESFKIELHFISEWISSIMMLLGTVFFGIPAAIGVAVGYGLIKIFYLSVSKIMLLMLSKFMMGLIIFLASGKLKRLRTMKEIIYLMAFSVLACFISFIFHYYFTENGYVDSSNMFTIMNYLTSNTSCVIGVGIPLCVLIFRLKKRKEAVENRNEWTQIKTAMVTMPVYLTVFLIFFMSLQHDNPWSEKYWFKGFLNVTVFMLEIMIACVLLSKWKRITLMVIAAIFMVVSVMGFINKDPYEAIMLVLAAVIYLVFRIIFFAKAERNIEIKKWVKNLFLIFNIIFIAVLTMEAALNNTISVLPMGEFTEKYTIVLGAPVYEGEASDILDERIREAEKYASVNPDSIYFVTGGIKENSNGMSEAEMIANRLVSRGIDPANIEMDCEAKTTVENFDNIRKIFEARGYNKEDKVLLITSKFHYPRSTQLAFDAGFTNLSYGYMNENIFSNFLWSVREAIVYPFCLIGR